MDGGNPGLIAFDEALTRVLGMATPLDAEVVTLDEACDRVLARPVAARSDSPAAAVSAMDGWAVRDADLRDDATVRLPIAGQVFAGSTDPGDLPAGACARVFTGAPLPRGADRVVIQEVVAREGELAVMPPRPSGGRHVREAGSDFRAGEILLQAGLRLSAHRLPALAAADLAEVAVIRRPEVAILATGDELAAPGTAWKSPGALPESVSLGVAGLVRSWGGLVVDRRRLRDDPEALAAAAAKAIERADIVVTTGGASVGERDFARSMFSGLGLEVIFAKVAIKPGKPVWLGRCGRALVLGLPGNPTSALVTARLLLAPLVAGLAGRDPLAALAWSRSPTATALGPCGDRETFLRARRTAQGVSALDDQDSGSQRALARADALIRRRSGDAAAQPGEIVEALDL